MAAGGSKHHQQTPEQELEELQKQPLNPSPSHLLKLIVLSWLSRSKVKSPNHTPPEALPRCVICVSMKLHQPFRAADDGGVVS